MGQSLKLVMLGIVIAGLTGCKASNYKFTKDFSAPVLDCPAKPVCAAPVTGCRWVEPGHNLAGCETGCGKLSCDAPKAPVLNSLEQILDNDELKWSKVESPGELHYRISRKIAGSDALQKSEKDKGVLSLTDPLSVFGKEYFYSVTAFTQYGESEPSNELSLIPIEHFGVEKGLAGNAHVKIQWKNVLGATSFEVRGAKSGEALNVLSATLLPSDSGWIAEVTGLENGVAYDFDVVAKNSKVRRVSDNRVSLIPFDGFQLTSRAAGPQTATVTWSPLVGASSYRLTYWDAANKAGTTKTVELAGTLAQTISGLTNGTLYTFQVCAMINGECTPTKNTLNARPIAVPVISGVEDQVLSLKINWGDTAGAEQFQVSTGTIKSAALNATTRTVLLSVPTPEVTAAVKVVATNNDGGIAESAPVTGTPFGSFRITASDDSSAVGTVSATWGAYSAGYAYKLIMRLEAVETFSPVTTNLTQSVGGLAPEETYVVSIEASKGSRKIRSENSVNLTPKGVFHILSATAGAGKVDLKWEVYPRASSYEISITEMSGTVRGTKTTVTVAGDVLMILLNLKQVQEYEFVVMATTPKRQVSTPAVNTTTTRDVIKILKPAVAVRGTGCMICHANISGNLITDMGFGGNGRGFDYFFGAHATGTAVTDETPRWESIYGDHDSNWSETSITNGSVYVPFAPIDTNLRDVIETFPTKRDSGENYVNAPNPSTVSTLKKYLDFRKSINRDSPVWSVGLQFPIVEKQTVYIGAPTEQQVLAAAGEMPTEHPSWKYTPDAVGGLSLTGLEDKGAFISNSIEGEFQCDGDLVVTKPLLLLSLNIRTGDNGCRIYATKSVFIQGSISYLGDAPNRNLQITSSRAIMAGLGYGTFNWSGQKDELRDNGKDGIEYRLRRSIASQFFYSRQMDRASDVSVFNERILTDASLLKSPDGKILILKDAEFTRGGRDAGFERILLNAPIVHSRHKGEFKGSIIAETAVLSLGAFTYEFDSVFERVSVLPLIDRALILKVSP